MEKRITDPSQGSPGVLTREVLDRAAERIRKSFKIDRRPDRLPSIQVDSPDKKAYPNKR